MSADLATCPPWTPEDSQISRRTWARLRMLTPLRPGPNATQAELDRYREAVAEIVERARGIVLGEWVCACGLPYTAESYPMADCKCGRPFPRICVTPGCGRRVDPVEARTETAGHRKPGRTEHRQAYITVVNDRCPSCETDNGYRDRAHRWAHSEVPEHERAVAVKGWWETPERQAAHVIIRRWLDAGLGREFGGPHALYVWGPPGRGKTVCAAAAAHTAYVDRGLVGSVVWTSQSELRARHDERWQRDTERAQRRAEDATSFWGTAREAPLLIVDDMFTAEPRGAFCEALADLVRDRLNARAPTIYTSNHAPAWSVFFGHDGGRIESRWSAAGITIEVGGADWRRA